MTVYDWDQTRVTRAVAAAKEAARRERERARVAPVSAAPAPLPQGGERPSPSKLGAAIDVKGVRWGMAPHHVFSLFQDADWEEEGQIARCRGELFDAPALLRFRFTPSGKLHAVSVVTRHATLDEAWPRFLEVASALTTEHGHPTKDYGKFVYARAHEPAAFRDLVERAGSISAAWGGPQQETGIQLTLLRMSGYAVVAEFTENSSLPERTR